MKSGIIWFIVIISTLFVVMKFGRSFLSDTYEKDGVMYVDKINKTKEVNISEFLKSYNSGDFQKIEVINDRTLKGYSFIGTGKEHNYMSLNVKASDLNRNVFETIKPIYVPLNSLGIPFTGSSTIDIKYKDEGVLSRILIQLIPFVLILVLAIFLLRGAMGKGGGPLGMAGNSGKKAKAEDIKTRFADVAGMDEVKEEVQEIVDFLKSPQKYIKAGAKIPSGVLLYGPPGNGKTLLARAIAGEAKVPFFYSSGSEFMEMLVGMGAAKVRELFKKARENGGPAIIFIDEIDAIGKKRGMGSTGGHQEQEQTLNQILTELDGFEKNHKTIVIAATNRIDTLDPALLRPGRFDRKILVNRPTLEERKEIIKVYLKGKKLNEDLKLDKLVDSLAIRTVGFVGAELANLVNESALYAAKSDRDYLVWNDFEYALEKVVAGPEKKIKSIEEIERKIIAYHELGHALTAHLLPNADPLEKISIVSRGMALGLTWIIPTKDQLLTSKAKFLDEIVVLLAGRASEEIFFGKDNITTGASNDMSRVYKIVYDMVAKYGMSDLGPTMYFDEQENEWKMYKPYSEKLSEKIDMEVEKIISQAYSKSKEIIMENKKTLHKLADRLLEKEYMSKEEFAKLIGKENAEPELIDPKKS